MNDEYMVNPVYDALHNLYTEFGAMLLDPKTPDEDRGWLEDMEYIAAVGLGIWTGSREDFPPTKAHQFRLPNGGAK